VIYPDERISFVDLETGGLEPTRPIIQIAAIAVDAALAEIESLEIKIRFDKSKVDPVALRKNSYDPETWQRDAVGENDAAKAFASFLRRHATVDCMSKGGRPYRVAQLAAHNAAFDGPFLRAWFSRLGMFLPAHPRVLCTLQRTVWLFHEHKELTPPADFALGTLCEYFGVRLAKEEAHDALADIRATVDLYRGITQSECAARPRRHTHAYVSGSKIGSMCSQ